MRKIVLSYPREDRSQVASLVKHLKMLGNDVFFDQDLQGSQVWWDAILSRIRDCDVLVAIVSTPALDSVACHRERAYAAELGKPIMPVAVEQLAPQALPRELSVRNVVDYSRPGEEAAFALAAALSALPATPPLPAHLPDPPDVPLSYLCGLMDEVDGADELTGDRQWQVLDELEPALRSSDRQENEGAQVILKKLAGRPELRADVEHRIHDMQPRVAEHILDRGPNWQIHGGDGTMGPAPAHPENPIERVIPAPTPTAPPKTSKVLITFAVLGVIFVLLIMLSMCDTSGSGYY